MCEICSEEGIALTEPRKSLDALLADGYREVSRINLSLAEEGVASDNGALELCEQKLAECE